MSLPPLRRLAHATVATVAPRLGGRWATDVFSRTRAPGSRPDDVLPLGARAFEVVGDPHVRRGYLWGGGSPTALLVHGWGTDSSSIQPLVAPLRDLGYSVAAFDAPGHGIWGGSQATMSEYTAAVAAVLQTLRDVRVIVAHSLGSIAAVGGVARTGPIDVDCMVLLAPTCTLSGVLDRWDPSDLRVSTSVRASVYRELHRRNGVPVSHWDLRTLGTDVRCPTLVLHDSDDPVVPFGDAEAVTAAREAVRLVPVRGRGHAGILMAAEVKEAISGFVAEHRSQRQEEVV